MLLLETVACEVVCEVGTAVCKVVVDVWTNIVVSVVVVVEGCKDPVVFCSGVEFASPGILVFGFSGVGDVSILVDSSTLDAGELVVAEKEVDDRRFSSVIKGVIREG